VAPVRKLLLEYHAKSNFLYRSMMMTIKTLDGRRRRWDFSSMPLPCLPALLNYPDRAALEA
jgi:hypothetical protein